MKSTLNAEGLSPSEYTNTSRVIHIGPCIVYDVTVAGDGANGDCQVYDGTSNKGKLKAHIEVLSGASFSWRPGLGTLLLSGIYIVVNAATTKVTVTYDSVTEKISN